FPQTENPFDVVQVRVALHGQIDSAQIRAACQKIAHGNSDSQTTNGNGTANGNGRGHVRPAQARRLSWQEHDLRGLTAEEVRTWTTSFLETDKNQSIPAECIGLMRVALIHTGSAEGELVWSFHRNLREMGDARRMAEELRMACGATVQVEQISDKVQPPQNALGNWAASSLAEHVNGTNGTATEVVV